MFGKIINIGVHPELDSYQKRETRVLNVIASVIFFGLLVGATNVFFLGEQYPYIFNSSVGVFTSLILYFNHKRWHMAASYAFVITMVFTLTYVSNYYERSTGTMVYFFPVIFCIALLHNPNKPKYHLVINMVLILLGFIISQSFQLSFIKPGEFSDEQIVLLRYYNIYFSVSITIAMVFLLIQQVNKQYKELNALIHKLEDNQIIVSASLKEKEILIKELQHRVKNNMSILIGLFNFQRESSNNQEVKNALIEAKNRVLSIAMVHQHLYGKTDLSKINLKNYISELTDEVVNSHPQYTETKIIKDLEDVTVDITKAIPIGLIINEVYTNSFKHAFKNAGVTPEFRIGLKQQNNSIELTMNDNGSGFPETIIKNSNSLGQNLMESLTDQIDGKISFTNRSGALVSLCFPA